MQAYFFTSSAGQLFGAFHSSALPTVQPVAVVLCPPFGEEGVIAYGALRQLAIMASTIGYNTLMFEYFGTGDSEGDCEAFTLAQACEDTRSAVAEACELSGLNKVVLVGLRLGAMPALEAAESESRVVATVLWDPVLDGEAYLGALLRDTEKLSPADDDSGMRPGVDIIGIDGFPLTPQLYSELENYKANTRQWSARYEKFLVHSGNTTNGSSSTLDFAQVAIEPSEMLWRESPGVDTQPRPTAAMQQIISFIEGLVREIG